MSKTTKNSKIKLLKNDVLIFATFIILAFVVIQLTSLSIFGTKGVEVSQIRKKQQQYIVENEILQSKINELQSLERIEKIATEDFGMIEVDSIEYIQEESDTVANAE